MNIPVPNPHDNRARVEEMDGPWVSFDVYSWLHRSVVRMLYQPFDANSQHMGLPWTSMDYVSTTSSSVNDSWVVKALLKGICPSNNPKLFNRSLFCKVYRDHSNLTRGTVRTWQDATRQHELRNSLVQVDFLWWQLRSNLDAYLEAGELEELGDLEVRLGEMFVW